MTSLRLGIVAICLSSVSSFALADDGLGQCSPSSSHATVPSVQDLTYDEARKLIVKAGWKSKVTRANDGTSKAIGEDFYGNVKDFWMRGYHEIEACAVDRNSPCIFRWVDKRQNSLTVYTAGEERPEQPVRATVTNVELMCRQ